MKYKSRYLICLMVMLTVILLPDSVFADFGTTTLKRGMTHPDVIVLQQKLKELGFFQEEQCTKHFGSKTEEAVRKFQASVGLNVDGAAGKKTFEFINIKINQKNLIPEGFTQLVPGDQGELVKTIQQKLQQLKLLKVEPSGVYDEATKEAVSTFQAQNNLEENGIIDKATLVKISTAALQAVDRGSSRPESGIEVVNYAREFLGRPYKWGASTGKSFDCSGFVMYIFKRFDVTLSHRTDEQYAKGLKIEKSDLRLGDAVFFTTYKKGPSHVGIYIGENQFIHASSRSGKVIITNLNTSYYKGRYLGARRYL